MELSTEILGSLTLAGDSSRLPDNCFEKLIKYAIGGVLRPEECGSFLGEDKVFRDVDHGVVKQSFFGLVSLFIECSRHGIDSDSLQSVLDDCKMSADRAALITKTFQDNNSLMANYLKNITFQVPHIVDVNWTLDYCIKSNHMEKINQATYIISLSTETGNSETPKNIVFTCTVEQLQDLVNKLKDAVKCFERISQR